MQHFPNNVYELISNPQRKYMLSYFSFTIPVEMIPSTVTRICCNAFKDISIPPSVAVISNALFNGCKSFARFAIHPSVTYIDPNAFINCLLLRKITISSS